jgi:hypothetical protein
VFSVNVVVRFWFYVLMEKDDWVGVKVCRFYKCIGECFWCFGGISWFYRSGWLRCVGFISVDVILGFDLVFEV